MKNSDMPATAVEFRNPNMSGGEDIGQWRGLTKREAFAMAAMQGLMANSHLAEVLTSIDKVSDESAQDVLILTSVQCADYLLKELEK